MPSLAFLALFAAIGLLALIPTRRLFLAGWKSNALTAYFAAVVSLALFVAELRGPARYLIPILVVVYVAPFVTAREGIARLRDRWGGIPPGTSAGSGPSRPRAQRPEPKNVTPKEASPPDS